MKKKEAKVLKKSPKCSAVKKLKKVAKKDNKKTVAKMETHARKKVKVNAMKIAKKVEKNIAAETKKVDKIIVSTDKGVDNILGAAMRLLGWPASKSRKKKKNKN